MARRTPLPPMYVIPVSDVTVGDVLVPDGGFICLPEGKPVVVQRDPDTNKLFVSCSEGKHFLDEQFGDDEKTYVGFLKARDFGPAA